MPAGSAPLDREVNVEEELTSKGSVFMEDEGESCGKAKVGCAMKSETLSTGAYGSKCSLRSETVKG